MLIDSHCHLNLLNLENYPDLDAVIHDCKAHNINKLLCVAIDLEHFNELVQIAHKYDMVSISAGVHPNEDKIIPGEFDISNNNLYENLLKQAKNSKVIAIGETGLDFYRSQDSRDIQIQRFVTHIEIATMLQKPLIIHTREAQHDTIDVLKSHAYTKINGIMHCFTESWEVAKKALDLGFYISLSGIVTFKNAKQVHEVATKVPLDRLLVETDCPYLAPMPYRGKPNYPHYVQYVAEKIAELRGESFDLIANQTTENFKTLFGQ